MNRKSMIIIGAGLAGLATGCYAQINGYESVIFEHHTKPGGLAAAWKRKEYLIDGGIHFLIAHKPGNQISDVYKEIGTNTPGSTVDMTTYLKFVNSDGTDLIAFTDDLDMLERDLIQLSPEDEEEIHSLVKEIRWMKDSPILTDLGMSVDPPELKGRMGSIKEMWSMRSFMKYFTGKFSKSCKDYVKRFQSPQIREIIVNLFSPDGPIWFVIMILACVAGGYLGLLTKGCPGFIDPIVERYVSLGGRIQYKSTVKEILVEDDKAIGILLDDGSKHMADIIVSAADGYCTIYELLEGRYVSDKLEKIYKEWKPYDPTIMVSFCVRREFKSEAPLTVLMLSDPLGYGGRQTKLLPLRVFNYSSEFAPKGNSVIQVMLETEWEYWYDLQQNREAYEKEKESIAQNILECLERYYPGISEQVDVVDIATPHTTWRYTLNHKGSPMGWLMTKESIMTQIPRTLPGLENFYMAGQWVLPGGGVPSSVYTGRNVIQILCKKDGKKFKKQ